MPIYLRKEEGEPSLQTPSISEFKLQDDDFIVDPEILFDYLPQPYRMIDKMVELVLDIAWEKIEGIEAEKMRKAAERRVPLYSNPNQLISLHNVRCFCVSDGLTGDMLIVGTEDNKLAVLDCHNQQQQFQPLMTWAEENVVFTHIHCATITEGVIAILTEDVNGLVRLFVMALDRIHYVKAINEAGDSGGGSSQSKSTCVKCWLANDASAFAVHLEQSQQSGTVAGSLAGSTTATIASSTSYIDVYKCPIDAWMKEIDTANQQYQKQINSATDVTTISAPVISFSKPNPSLRVRPPQLPQGITAAPHEMLRRADNVVAGTGLLGHQLSQTHVDVADAAFDCLNTKNLHLLPPPEEVLMERSPEVILFTPGRLTPAGLGNEKEKGRVCSVGVWWSDMYYMSVYSLLKPPAKDIEHKPDSIVNFGGPVSCSVLSHDNVLLAFGFTDGTVILYDKEYGTAQQEFRSNYANCKVKKLMFVPPGVLSNPANPSSNMSPHDQQALEAQASRQSPLFQQTGSKITSQNNVMTSQTTKPSQNAMTSQNTKSTQNNTITSQNNALTSQNNAMTSPAMLILGSGDRRLNGLICLAEDGTLTLSSFSKLFKSELKFLATRSSSDDDPDKIVNFDVFSHGLTQLIIVTKLKGSLTLFDLISCEAVCELVLPESHTIYPSLTSSAKPATNQSQYLGVLAKGQSLIAYGSTIVEVEEEEEQEQAEEEKSVKSGRRKTPKGKNASKSKTGTISGSNASLTKSKSTIQIELEELEEVECVEEEKKRMRKETHFDVFMYQLRSFKTLDSYWSTAQSTSASNNQYVQRVSLDSLCASIFQNRVKDQSESVERLRKRWSQLASEVARVRDIRFNRTAKLGKDSAASPKLIHAK